MVGSKRSARSPRYSTLTPQTAAALASKPPLGFLPPPTLIGFKTIDPSVIALRVDNYNAAYNDKACTPKIWNTYIAFGIQDFNSPGEYYAHTECETDDAKNLRVARYYRRHLETKTSVAASLLKSIPAVETALAKSHPGYFDLSWADMCSYVAIPTEMEITKAISSLAAAKENISHSTRSESAMDTSSSSPPSSPAASTAIPSPTRIASPAVAAKSPAPAIAVANPMTPTKASTSNMQKPSTSTSSQSSTSMDTAPTSTVTLDESSPPVDTEPTSSVKSGRVKRKKQMSGTQAPPQVMNKDVPIPPKSYRPMEVKNILRVEARWAPKDFQELRHSTTKMYARLAPILSCFNTEHTWMMEWQTEQMPTLADLDPVGLSKFLSIQVLAYAKDQCFYFSFRLHATGSQFIQVSQSPVIQAAKRGESLSLDPSQVPVGQGELQLIGDILLKDASVTHRGHYLQHLRKNVLPPDAPLFNLKIRHKDPVGNKVPIISVRCGKAVSTRVAELLCTALCGEGLNSEIFIAKLAIGANHTSRQGYAAIYQAHMDFLHDVTYLQFPLPGSIDLPHTTYLDSGDTVIQTSRMWAEGLTADDGSSLEVDLENGKDGQAMMIVPSASLRQVQSELAVFVTRQNPTLSFAEKLYSESVSTNPEIPVTVFTKNIATILARRIKKTPHIPATVDDTSTAATPISSLTAATAKSSLKSSIAWKRPLQETLQYNKEQAKQTPQAMTSTEINQLKRIAILEAQLALSGGTSIDGSKSAGMQSVRSHRSRSSRISRTSSSQSTDRSPLTVASAHSRIEGLEAGMKTIQKLLKQLVTNSAVSASTAALIPEPQSPPAIESCLQLVAFPASPPLIPEPSDGMNGVQLFPPLDVENRLAIIESPAAKRPNNKRRKGGRSPPSSTQSQEQYTDPAEPKGASDPSYSGGSDKC